MLEHRTGPEFRVAGRTLSGVAMLYGDTAPDFRERFEPGAFGAVERVDVNLQHDPSLVVVRDALLTDSPRELRVRAELPAGSAALQLVKRGALNGFSIEFHAEAERREAGVRVIERAILAGLALVDRGAYPQSKAEIRRRGGGGRRLTTVRGRVPAGKRLACQCAGGDCTKSLFKVGAFRAGRAGREVLAVRNRFENPIGSRSRGSVRFWEGDDGALEFAVDIDRDTDAGRALLEQMERPNLPNPIARPYVGRNVEGKRDGDTMVFERGSVPLRALILGTTDQTEGWPALRRSRGDDDDMPDGAADPLASPREVGSVDPSSLASRRMRVWL